VCPEAGPLCARRLHTPSTAAAIPTAVLGHVPVVPRRMGRVWGFGLARGSLGARGERQCDEERGKPPPRSHRGDITHSITSSARARIVCGMVRPSALAVFRLMTSSDFVGCRAGVSAGDAPFNILSVSAASIP
jgi:hypothetical protein